MDLDIQSDISVDIDQGRSAFADALRRGDAAAAASIYAVDATLLAPAVDVVRGRAAIERFWRTGVDTGITEVELAALDVQRSGELAFEVGRYTLRVAPEVGAPVVDRGRYLIVHRLDPAGRWLRAAEMFSSDAEGATPPRA
jgi:ketosteroid isomerase-like protein